MICNKPFCVMHKHWIILYQQMEHGQQQEEAAPSSSKKQRPAGGKKQRPNAREEQRQAGQQARIRCRKGGVFWSLWTALVAFNLLLATLSKHG